MNAYTNTIRKGEGTMNRNRSAWLVATLAGFAMAGCGSAQANDPGEEQGSETFVRMINVEVTEVATQTFAEDIRLTAVAMANQDVLLEAEESGTIRTLFVDRGDAVSTGDWIAKIDDAILSAQVAQARAAAELAEQTWQRRKRLWEEDRVGSEIAYLEARFTAEQAAAALTGLEERLSNTVIRAPFAGIFDERYVDVGASVSPGVAIGRLVDLTPIKVVAGVPERYAPDVQVGTLAQLSFAALGGRVYEAAVRYVGATVDPQNRTFAIELRVANPRGEIKPQMVANLAVTRRSLEDVVVVPQDALVRVEDGFVAFVVVEREGNEVAEARTVEVGASRRNLVVLDSGVDPGERLIVVGQRSVADGDRVRIVGG